MTDIIVAAISAIGAISAAWIARPRRTTKARDDGTQDNKALGEAPD